MDDAIADHDRKLIALLDRCRERGIRLNKEKFKLRRNSVSYMGHQLTPSGLKVDPEKVEAIQKMPPPQDKPAVQRSLGMAAFLAKYVPNFSEVTAPIRTLLDKNNEFQWDTDVHGKAFDELKQLLQRSPVLRYYDVTKAITIQCDASQSGVAACLLQDGQAVAYASRALNEREQNFSQIEKELLSVIYSMEKFHTYVYLKKITVITDHKPLITINKKSLASCPRRLMRMFLRLQNYDFDLIYQPGSTLVVADTLSRAYPMSCAKSESEHFSEEIAVLENSASAAENIMASQTV